MFDLRRMAASASTITLIIWTLKHLFLHSSIQIHVVVLPSASISKKLSPCCKAQSRTKTEKHNLLHFFFGGCGLCVTVVSCKQLYQHANAKKLL